MAKKPNKEEKEENLYDEETREEMMDGDELSPEEDAFMKGYDEADEEEEEKEKDNEEEE